MFLVCLLPVVALAGDDTSIFSPASTPAKDILGVATVVLLVAAGIFFIVFCLLVFCIIRYRARPGDEERDPPQVYGSGQLELAWTVLPILIVIVLSLVAIRGVYDLEQSEPPDGALVVDVTGHQWWWEFQYPEHGIVTANELHVPVSTSDERKVTFLNLRSADVIHSFWVPRLAGKTDVIPNRVNHLWIEPLETGLYKGQCAEFCGTQHANMLIRVYVHPKEEFEEWVQEQKKGAVAEATPSPGRRLFQSLACINCHTDRGTVANGEFGPDLTHLMSRETLASGILANNRENLKKWLLDPQAVKPGALMPDMQLTEAEANDIVNYLLTLH